MNKIKIGVLGGAKIAQRYLIPELQKHYAFEFVVLASRSEYKAHELSKTLGVEVCIGYETLFQKYDLDAVYIPLPVGLHYEWIKYALENKIHVLSEKSLSITLEQANELNGLAKNNDLVLFENFQFRFHKQLDVLINLVNNEIGDIRFLSSSFCFPPLQATDIRYNKDLGGGALLDAGVYPLKISQIFLGQNLMVRGSVLNYNQIGNVDISGGALLTNTDSGVHAQLNFGFDNYYQCNINIVGSKGKVSTDRIFTAPPNLKTIVRLEKDNSKKEIEIEPDNHFKNMLDYFYKLVMVNKELRNAEYEQNISQAKLLNGIRAKSNER